MGRKPTGTQRAQGGQGGGQEGAGCPPQPTRREGGTEGQPSPHPPHRLVPASQHRTACPWSSGFPSEVRLHPEPTLSPQKASRPVPWAAAAASGADGRAPISAWTADAAWLMDAGWLPARSAGGRPCRLVSTWTSAEPGGLCRGRVGPADSRPLPPPAPPFPANPRLVQGFTLLPAMPRNTSRFGAGAMRLGLSLGSGAGRHSCRVTRARGRALRGLEERIPGLYISPRERGPLPPGAAVSAKLGPRGPAGNKATPDDG